MNDLKSLTKRRKTLKANLTRYKTFVTKVEKSAQDKDERISERYRSEASLRKTKMEPWLDQFESIQLQIEDLDQTESAESAEEARDKFETLYYEVLSALTEFSKDHSNPSAAAIQVINSSYVTGHQEDEGRSQASGTIASESHVSKPARNGTTHYGNKPQLKLPRISLPTFSGETEQWLNFRDMFDSLIHERDDITEIEKFQYLKTSLTGDAAFLIRAIPLSADNYNSAWKSVKTRFENKPQIIRCHLRSLVEIDCIPKESHALLQALLNNISSNVSSLKALGQPIHHWDTILIYLMQAKLDPLTKREWEKVRSETAELPTLQDFTQFLTKKCQLLESLQSFRKGNYPIEKSDRSKISHVAITRMECKVCKGDHALYRCSKFIEMSPVDRIEEVSRCKLCKNCLRSNHKTKQCKSSNCRTCGGQHNTLLHLDKQQVHATPPSNNQTLTETTTNNSLSCAIAATRQIFLPTAKVHVVDIKGHKHEARILLDSGSQSNFIRRDFFNELGINSVHGSVAISGINNSQSHSWGQALFTIYSRVNSYRCKVSCFILDTITSRIPQNETEMDNWQIPNDVQLADPSFSKPGQIDILLGVENFWSIICPEQISLGKRQPVLQATLFGWVVSGPTSLQVTSSNHLCFFTLEESNREIQQQLSNLWQIQEVPTQSILSPEQSECEKLFTETTIRNNEGRFIVRLPFKNTVTNLGQSYTIAKRRFFNIEKRLFSNPELHQQYSDVIHEYLRLGHMSPVNYDNEQLKVACFLPHHAVLRPDKTTTKLRVVFDASCKTDTGISLNDVLMVGPVVQPDLFTILLQFRLHPFAAVSDCEKMYRQMLVHPDDRIYQNVVWRDSSDSDFQTYQLNTVSFGTAPAPYLATRCVKQISLENSEAYPEACNYIGNSFYVDDFVASFEFATKATEIISQVNALLLQYGLNMRKWASNHPDILNKLPMGETRIQLTTDETTSCRTLGLEWEATDDTFCFPVKLSESIDLKITKRSILSATSSIFDPLGLIGPIVVKSKIILQRLWQANLSWDDAIPIEIHTMWCLYYNELSKIPHITIPRQVLCQSPTMVQLHAFSDASEVAYGTCIYLRSTNISGQYTVNLLCSKGRVAPLKVVTIPRLELMAAHLSSKLVFKITASLNLQIDRIFYWSDSTIVLAWLRKHPSQLKTFVAHRVADIITDTEVNDWFHVASADNPADFLSRGTSIDKLKSSSLWWHGPAWLSKEDEYWPKQSTETTPLDIPEVKKSTSNFTVIQGEFIDNVIQQLVLRYSRLTKLLRVMAYVLRYMNNIKKHSSKMSGPLSIVEIEQAHTIIVRQVQAEVFPEELKLLKTSKKLPLNNRLTPLNPFIDNSDILRIGGRIRHSNMPYETKFPIILPTRHPFTNLVIWHYHRENLHAGPNTTLHASRQRYWIIAGKRPIIKVTRSECIKCRQFNAQPAEPIMGDIPKDRLIPSKPFSVCGTDFAGPFMIRSSIRGSKTTKAYLCLFVCFITKAVHLELVSDLSANAFIACLRRFISRRGLCKTIYSDNGTNYVGASNQLKEWYAFLRSQSTNEDIHNFLSQHSITWKFIPARSPNFGGLWESAVKSAKRHLHKMTVNVSFTYDELNTLFCQIESVMNSRPLIPVPAQPNDLPFLTPGHFLIGDSLQALPEPNLLEVKQNRLKRFEMIQQLHQQFWRSWSRDYLNHLQSRQKWQQSTQIPMQEGDVVLLKEPNPPLMWRMGRVMKLHPGLDHVVRVVTIKTSSGELKRPVTKLVPLISA